MHFRWPDGARGARRAPRGLAVRPYFSRESPVIYNRLSTKGRLPLALRTHSPAPDWHQPGSPPFAASFPLISSPA